MSESSSPGPLRAALSPYSPLIYGVMRIVLGVLFAFHGLQKVFGVLTDSQPPVMTQMWIGGVLELVTGTLLALGLFTRWAAFVASGMMAVAYFQFHWKFLFDANFFPVVNRGELAVVYCFVFFYIASKGPGRLSLGRESEDVVDEGT